ncbi:hypothetical protein IMSHALPRED_006659 [Imshaugia aleurites]|uniref:Uncharacterized protein n=1 Tax=Imshaugia aleurites TaxID=172621 RepID=A0A8H3EQI7_9LECA|nr:hypothetical protein IMSHALPRED_006659 [Imshaugia aleurites]
MTTVNRPTNVKQKEADVNQKLQLYGIYSAFANGKVPSNKQIDVALNSAIASKALSTPSPKLSEEGRHLVADLRNVIEQAKILLLTKNEGNLLQDFIYQTGQVSGGQAKLPGAPIDKNTAQQHGNQALEGLRTLGTLVLTNGQFRKLLSDASVLLRDIAGDAAQKTATKINPSEDDLNQIDEPAEDNTWHDLPSASNLKSQAKDQYNKQKPFSRNDLQNAAGDATQAAHPSGSRDPADAAMLEAESRDQGTDSGMDPNAGANTAMDNLRGQASANVPDETKDKARNARERTKNYMREKVPKERRDQTIFRLKKMIVEIQSHSDYQQSIETLLSLAEEYGGHSKNLSQQGAGTVKGAHSDTALTSAETDLKTLLERFANSTSADDLIDSINAVYRDADKDPELKGWFKSIDRYVRKCLKESGFIMQDRATEEWNQLSDKGNFLLRERYRDHTNRVLDEFKFFGQQFDEDAQNKRFAASMQKLFNDLGNDQNGKPTFKPHLVKDLSTVIVPGIFESVRYVPVPRIEYTDPMVDAIIENLVIESDNLAPNSFEFGSDNYFRWGRKTVTSKNKNKVMVSVSGVQMDLKDVSYYVNKKQGFPSLKDTGVMDIFMGGSGFSFKIAMETADKSDRQHFFKINTVTVDIKSLTIKLKQSKHKTLFNLFRPLMFAVLRPAVGKVLEKLIKDQVHNADAKAYSIYKEAEKAGIAAQQDPENAPNIYSRYVTAAQNEFTNKQQKAQEVSADKKANVAMTQMDSIFPEIKLPGGISTKATEYKQLAAKGDKWESPIFGIGSAAETKSFPTISKVTRKPHSAASGGVKGPQNLEAGQSTFGQAQPRTEQGYDQANGSSGFSSQVDQSFGNTASANDYSFKNTSGAANGGITDGNVSGRTTLGMNNPVLSGSV